MGMLDGLFYLKLVKHFRDQVLVPEHVCFVTFAKDQVKHVDNKLQGHPVHVFSVFA